MQNIEQRRNGAACKSCSGRSQIRPCLRSIGQKTYSATAGTGRNAFLKQKIKPVPAASPYRDIWLKDLANAENYAFLHECATNYAAVLGKRLGKVSGRKLFEKYNSLYYRFMEVLPAKYSLNIDAEMGHLHWTLYHRYNWDDSMLYWLPVAFVNRLPAPLRDIAVEFLRAFHSCNNLSSLRQSYDFETIADYMQELVSTLGQCSEQERASVLNLLLDYQQGKRASLLDEMEQPPTAGDTYLVLRDLLFAYKPADELEYQVQLCLMEGLSFIQGQSIMDFDYDPDAHFEMDDIAEQPVGLDRIIRFVYQFDELTEQIEAYLNEELKQRYALSPVSAMPLTYDSSFWGLKDNYPERFSRWFLEAAVLFNKLSEAV